MQYAPSGALNRNETGLVLVVGGAGCNQFSVLLPADVSIGILERWGSCSFEHIMVPYHGGRTDLATVPKHRSKRARHAVHSYGLGNIFLHPLTETQRTFRKTWKNADHIALPALQVKPETRLQSGRSALDIVKEPAHAQPLGASRSWAPPGPD